MIKRTFSFLLVLTMLATCLIAAPVLAGAADPLSDIVKGGYWADTTVIMDNNALLDMGISHSNVTYTKSTHTATQTNYYGTVKLASFEGLDINEYDEGGLELQMTITPSGTVDDFKGTATKNTSKVVRVIPYIDGTSKNSGASNHWKGLYVKHVYSSGAMKYGFPWGTNEGDFELGTGIPVKFLVTKKDGKLTTDMQVQIDGEWKSGSATDLTTFETDVTETTGKITGFGLNFGSDGYSGTMKWVLSDAKMFQKTPTTVRLSDHSEYFYGEDEVVPVDFVLPVGYQGATLTIDDETIAYFDPESYPAGAYTANLNLGAIGKVAIMEMVLSGNTEEEDFFASTIVRSGIDPNYVPPMEIPAKVSFVDAAGNRLNAISSGATVKAVAEESLKTNTIVLGLYENKILKAIKSGTGEAAITVPEGIDASKAVLKAFIMNSLDDANLLVRAGQWNSNDLTLADILIQGKAMEGYSDDTDTYTVELPASFKNWPDLEPVANNSASSAVISYNGTFPEGNNTIAMTAEDGTTRNITLNYTVKAPEILNGTTAVSSAKLTFLTLEKPLFVAQPKNPVVGTNAAKDQNQEYALNNIKNPIQLFNDRQEFWFVDLPDELVGATLVSPPYNSSFWNASANNESQEALISFDLTRSATVYVYAGNGFKGSSWISKYGWTQDIPFDHPLYIQKHSTNGLYCGHRTSWPGYQKHFEVAPGGEPVTVNIGAINWSTNAIIVKFD